MENNNLEHRYRLLDKEYKTQIDNLKQSLNDKIEENNQKDLELNNTKVELDINIAKRNDMNKLIESEKLKSQEKFTEMESKLRTEFEKKLTDICNEFQGDLNLREKIWKKAKEESLKSLYDAYFALKQDLMQKKESLEKKVNELTQEIQSLRNINDKLQKKIIDEKDVTITKLEAEIDEGRKKISTVWNCLESFLWFGYSFKRTNYYCKRKS